MFKKNFASQSQMVAKVLLKVQDEQDKKTVIIQDIC